MSSIRRSQSYRAAKGGVPIAKDSATTECHPRNINTASSLPRTSGESADPLSGASRRPAPSPSLRSSGLVPTDFHPSLYIRALGFLSSRLLLLYRGMTTLPGTVRFWSRLKFWQTTTHSGAPRESWPYDASKLRQQTGPGGLGTSGNSGVRRSGVEALGVHLHDGLQIHFLATTTTNSPVFLFTATARTPWSFPKRQICSRMFQPRRYRTVLQDSRLPQDGKRGA
jgi:hypothetical protein